MRHHFTATQCLPIVLDEEPCPSDQDAYQLWIEKDGRAMGTLLGACSQEMAIHIESSSSSADMWKILAGIANSAAHRKSPADRAIRPFQLIHSDSCTITTSSLSGSRYYLLFVDDFTYWTFVYFLNQKNAATCTRAFNEIIAYINTQYSSEYKVQQFRCDNGSGEYDNHLLREALADNGISF